jgi:hypothetical protein
MDLRDKKGIPVEEAIKDQKVSEAYKKVVGTGSLCAPFPRMAEKWTDEKKAELDRVLNRYPPKR